MRRGTLIAICVLCLFNGCVCNCGPQSSGSCELIDAGDGGGGCTFDAGFDAEDAADAADSTIPGEDAGPDAGEDAEAEAAAVGLCNGTPCPAGCACDLADDEAGGGVCVCADGGDAGSGDATTADAAADATSPFDAADGATSPDASVADAGGHADASVDAATDASEPGACGVITCGAGCVCISEGASQCVCP